MNTMKVALMSVINSKNFKLLDVQRKIKELWATNDLNDEEKDELLAAAMEAANPEAERPEQLAMMEALAERIAVLEEKVAVLEAGGTEPEPETEIPAWKPWDGISKDYVYGAKVTHNGKIWQSEFNGQNTWEPGVVGTEALWVEVTE